MAMIQPKVYQLKYYGPNNKYNTGNDNVWVGLSADGTKSKNLLEPYGPVVKLGIQTLPGVRFSLSNSGFTHSIIVDHTGIYELDLRNTTTAISELRFSVDSLARINEIDNASIIVDILCNE